MAFFIDVKVGESIKLGEAVIVVLQKSGQRVRLEVDAPPTVKVKREPKK